MQEDAANDYTFQVNYLGDEVGVTSPDGRKYGLRGVPSSMGRAFAKGRLREFRNSDDQVLLRLEGGGVLVGRNYLLTDQDGQVTKISCTGVFRKRFVAQFPSGRTLTLVVPVLRGDMLASDSAGMTVPIHRVREDLFLARIPPSEDKPEILAVLALVLRLRAGLSNDDR